MISFKIAVRFLKAGGSQTALIVIGIAVAISIQVFVGLLIDSLQKTLVDRTIGSSPHITITSSTDTITIRNWKSIIEKIRDFSSTEVITLSASGSAFTEKGDNTLPLIIKGFEFEGADRIYGIRDSLYEGRQFDARREVLIGKELKEEIEAEVGDKIDISTPNGEASTFTISGFYDLGVAGINKTWVFVNIKTAQRLFGFSDRVTSIEMTVNDLFEADLIARQMKQLLGNEDVQIENWKEQNEELLSGLEGQRTSSLVIQFVIIVSVIIAISSVLALSVLQKSREIGILKAIGIKDLPASFIFIHQGFLVGLAGSTLGIILGLILLYGFNAFTTNPDGSTLIDLYVEYDFILRSWFIALLASTLAGIIPARRSLKLSPVEVIREG